MLINETQLQKVEWKIQGVPKSQVAVNRDTVTKICIFLKTNKKKKKKKKKKEKKKEKEKKQQKNNSNNNKKQTNKQKTNCFQ